MKFSAKEIPLEEKVNECFRKFNVIIEKIQSYDQVLEKFKEVISKIEEISGIQLENEKKLSYFESSLKTLQSVISQNFLISTTQFQENNVEIRKVKCSLEDLSSTIQDDISHFKEGLYDCKSKIRNIIESSVQKSSIDQLQKEQKSLKSMSDKVIDRLIDMSDSLKNCNLNFEEYKKLNSIETFQEQIDNIEFSLKDTSNNVSNKIKNCVTLDTLSKFYSSKVEPELISIKDQLINQPSLESLQKNMMEKIEKISLDASNSVLKANNCSKQIEIVERKIENISLLVKKIELSK